jgi:hypothetical protein
MLYNYGLCLAQEHMTGVHKLIRIIGAIEEVSSYHKFSRASGISYLPY